MKSLFKKILLLYTAALCAILLIFGITGAIHLKQDHIKNTEEALVKNLDQLKQSFLDNPAAQKEPDIFCKKYGKIITMRITIISSDGKALGDSDAEPLHMENHLDRPEIQKAKKNGYGSNLRFSHTVERDMLYVAKPLENGGFIRVALPLKTLMHSFSNLFYTLFIVLTLSGALILILGILTTKRITSPLASSLSSAQDQLSHTIDHLTQEKQKLSAILTNLYDGVLAIHKDKSILLCNESLQKILDLTDRHIIGKKLFEILCPPLIISAIEDCLKSGTIHQKQIKIVQEREKYFECIISPLFATDKSILGAVAIFHDITELKHVEQMRVDFVANVSHELKTPLTSIRGYTDTLLDGALEDPAHNKNFLNIIRENTLRLTRLVEDLLTLSQLESQPSLTKKEVHLKTCIDEVLTHLTPYAEKKNITLTTDIHIHSWMCDSQKIEQALSNLVHNAIQYNPSQSTIAIKTASHPQGLKLSVSDNGAGISSEHLPRIFERFYRVDRSRSRELGGTGLGLSIVKHVALLHGGSVEVESTLDRGSTFSLILPSS
ncbi:MAG: hypothetical protein A3B70_00325 [Deltaproteobacteria bacterium RIFCSPHIGHO2_02_FULL_40_11]|nr:MAG: hypothetical protein A3B70_00325 [Deltaproteobacteria bacterium RIFCSPHIGHO2_02_FULL_40_11]